jgi:hypothetical protein
MGQGCEGGGGEEGKLGLKSLSDPFEEASVSPSVDIQQLSKTEIYAILACGYEIQMTIRPDKYICIYSYSQAALKALQVVKTMFPSV